VFQGFLLMLSRTLNHDSGKVEKAFRENDGAPNNSTPQTLLYLTMNSFYKIVSYILVAFTLFGSNAAAQSAGPTPQDGDLCNGTGGNGQIVNVGNNSFTLKRNDDGSNQIIELTRQTTTKTSAGAASFTDLKIGDRVTLIGDQNNDGSFTAMTVLVCKGTKETDTIQKTPSGQHEKVDSNRASKWNVYINVSVILLVVLIWILIVLFLQLNRKKNLVYLIFFTIFYVYIVEVLDYTLFQFQSLLIKKHFIPDLMLKGQEPGKSINLVPLIRLTSADLRTSLLNILLMMPFGFGLPFLTNYRMKKIVFTGALFSVIIELLQFLSGFMANISFRVADINDVIFNTMGAAIGYILFIGFLRIYDHSFHNGKISTNPVLRYIAERPQLNNRNQAH